MIPIAGANISEEMRRSHIGRSTSIKNASGTDRAMITINLSRFFSSNLFVIDGHIMIKHSLIDRDKPSTTPTNELNNIAKEPERNK